MSLNFIFLLGFASLGLFVVLVLAMLDTRRQSLFGWLIPWERRRRVPWNGWDVLLIFFLYFLLTGVSVSVTRQFFAKQETPPITTEYAPTAKHPLTQLIQQGDGSPLVLLVAFYTAVLAAPFAEEFFFRSVLQGWLERTERPFVKKIAGIPGVFAVTATSLLFAAMHGGGRQEQNLDALLPSIIGVGIANTLFPLLAVGLLRLGRGATLKDLGLHFHRLSSDIGKTVLAFFLFVPPVFFLNVSLQTLFPEAVTDPIPLFFFAVGLGFLAYRTRRLVSCVLLHAMLNATSFMALVVTS